MDKKSGKSYDFYNKPHGLLHWLDSPNAPPQDAIVALLDPDFIFMRPLTYKIAKDKVLYTPTVTDDEVKHFDEVREGYPVAQQYGIGSHWVNHFNVPYIAGKDSPATKTSISDAFKYYSVGPPYLVHRSDMHKIAVSWVEMVPKVIDSLIRHMYNNNDYH